MSVKTRSARGEVVDFDLLKIKEQIASNPAPTDVKARQNFVDRRLRRRVKNSARTEFDKAMPTTEDLSEDPKLIDEIVEEEVVDQVEEIEENEEDVAEETTPRRRSRKTKAPE